MTDFNEMTHKLYRTDESGTVTLLNNSKIKNSTKAEPDEIIETIDESENLDPKIEKEKKSNGR